MVTNPYRTAVDMAVRDVGKPLADLTVDEAEALYLRALNYLAAWNRGLRKVLREA